MSVIQKIRDKYARWAVIAIAISLIGFLLMDAFAGRTGLFSNSGPGNTLGKVNGKSIDRIEFQQDMDKVLEQQRQQNQPITDELREQVLMGLWDQKVTDIVMEEEYERLGLAVTDKELRADIMANPQLIQKYTDEKGNFNSIDAQKEINEYLKDPEKKEGYRKYILQRKYMALFSNTLNYPKWFIEKKNQDASLLANVSYVNIPYGVIDDKAVNVTDQEIEQYIKDHKETYEQKEETRTISFVAFNAAATSADSAAIRSDLEKLKEQFATDTNTANFVAQQQGEFNDYYVGANDIQSMAKDTIMKLPVGTVYGPYVDGANYRLAKMVAVKQLPDSVKSRHILVAFSDLKTGQPKLSDSAAKAKADSIAALIQGGANFDSLVVKLSDDDGSKEKGGVYDMSSTELQSRFVKEYTDFVLFDGKTGDKKVVKTQFGYHYIEIMAQKNVSPHFKIAYIGKEIVASEATASDAQNKATQFAGDSHDGGAKSFDDLYEKKLKGQGYLKSTATVMPLQSHIQGLAGSARSFVKNIFDASNDEVLAPVRIEDQYVVAVVTGINKPGLQSVAQARTTVEPVLRNKKKGEEIIKKIGQYSTLEEVSTKMGQPVQPLDSITMDNPKNLGYEPRVIGAAFNPSNKDKVVTTPIAGTNGVFVIRVNSISTTPIAGGSIEDQQKMLENQTKQAMSGQYGGESAILSALKKDANVKDNRAKFY